MPADNDQFGEIEGHTIEIDGPSNLIGAFAPGGEDWTAGWADYPLN